MDTTDSPLDWVLAMAPYRRDAEHLETLLAIMAWKSGGRRAWKS